MGGQSPCFQMLPAVVLLWAHEVMHQVRQLLLLPIRRETHHHHHHLHHLHLAEAAAWEAAGRRALAWACPPCAVPCCVLPLQQLHLA